MGLYQANGYIDIRKILSYGMVFNWLVGARGIGKTYSALETVIEDKIQFCFMRRTKAASDKVNNADTSPFKRLNQNKGWCIYPFSEGGGIATFREGQEDENHKIKPVGKPLGISVPLSTLATLRGVDMSDVTLLLYDEFIKEPHERPIVREGEAFLNAYETLNRNRELEGEPPMKFLGMANSNDLGNPIFVHLGLVEHAIKLQQSDRDFLLLPERDTALFMPKRSPISERKANTALYRMTQNTGFRNMALKNAFYIEGEDTILSVNLQEYKPVVTVGALTVYEHKSKQEYFVSFHRSGTPDTYKAERIELLRFKNRYLWLWGEHMEKNIRFETYSALKIFEEYFKTA